jgi:hypothetical protein
MDSGPSPTSLEHMTKEQARRLQEVAGWIADGRQIQMRYPGGSSWHSVSVETWGTLTVQYEYRLKLEPREWWLVGGYPYLSLASAQTQAAQSNREIIHVKEVL